MSAIVGFIVGFVVGFGATMIALVVIDEWKDQKEKETNTVEEVRCKDCKHWDADEYECNIKTGWFACGGNYSCADGERVDT